MNHIRVLLVDNHAALRAQLRQLISSQGDLHLVAEAGTVREAVAIALREALTVIIMDLSLPDGDGISATAEILQQRPELRVLGLTRHEDRGYLARMLAAGARGYVLKHHIAEGLLTAIRTVAAGGTHIDPTFTTRQLERPTAGSTAELEAARALATPTSELNAEELAVMKRVAWGHTNHEIALQLDMPAPAVAEHKAHAMQKLALRTRVDVVRYAEAQDWKRTDPSEA
jgi:DNA-binding NarL/FixJ family response regulator